MSVRLFVGSLPYETTEGELREYFSAVGPLSFVSLPRDRETNKLRGFAFVEFENPADAAEAIRRFNGQSFKGRLLAVNEARARESRPQTGAARPYESRQEHSVERNSGRLSQAGEKPGRNFGPDAPPRRTRKRPHRGFKSPDEPKRSLSEKIGGRFYGGDDESLDNDGENFASRQIAAEGDDII